MTILTRSAVDADKHLDVTPGRPGAAPYTNRHVAAKPASAQGPPARARRGRCAVAVVSRGLPAPGRPAPGRRRDRDAPAEGWPVRWVQPETSHLTLHFLGETEPERAGAGPAGPAGRRRRARAVRPAHGGTRRLPQLPPATRALARAARTGASAADVAAGHRSRAAWVGVCRRRRAVSPAHHPGPGAQRRWRARAPARSAGRRQGSLRRSRQRRGDRPALAASSRARGRADAQSPGEGGAAARADRDRFRWVVPGARDGERRRKDARRGSRSARRAKPPTRSCCWRERSAACWPSAAARWSAAVSVARWPRRVAARRRPAA